MKKSLLLVIAIVAMGCIDASAQNWLDALKGAATSAIDKATGGKLTEKAIIGTWKYSQPAVKLTSSTNALSDVAGSAASSTIQSKIKPYYEKVGIKSGACAFVFKEDGNLKMENHVNFLFFNLLRGNMKPQKQWPTYLT